MHVAEKWGLGIPNAMHEFVEHGLLEPEYTDWGNAVKVTVRRRAQNGQPADTTVKGPVNVTVNDTVNDTVSVAVNDLSDVTANQMESALLALIKHQPGKRADFYSKRLGKTKRTIMRYLAKLSEEIEFRGAPKTGGYYCK